MKRTISGIITLIFLAAACYFIALPLGGVWANNMTARQDAPLKKELPKKVTLAKDSNDDKYGEVAFDHDTHSTKNYSRDGKALIACAECHHTDQPAASLKPPLKLSERKVVLTLESLKAPDAAGVKTCRACHLQAGDDSKEMPTMTESGKTLKLNNEVAYHRNCNNCHDDALKLRPELKAKKLPGNAPSDCINCHKAIE
jgi:hypothetical protein